MANRPAWVVQELADILGFDEATVAEAILPELESQNHQARLQSHLQDFLGPSPKSRLFIDRYISLRFPSIPTPTPTSQPSLKPPRQPKPTGSWSPQPASGSSTPDLSKEIGEAFGKLGSVYTKITPYTGGSSTPQFRQSTRQAGAVVINDAREGKGKGKVKASNTANEQAKGDKIWDVPKSKEVLRLEGIKEKLGTVQDGGKVSRSDDLPDCFCQARIHKLSTYTPHCPHCGLILCELQPPFLPCPSCSQSLYSSAQLSRLIHRLTNDIESRLALELSHREAEERERQNRLIAESGGGAFPTLPGASHPKQGTVVQNGRKVLTIGKGGKKATLTTTTYRPSPPSTPIRSITPPPNDIVPRPRSPPLDPARIEKEWNKVSGWRHTEDRPWGDMKGDKRGEGWSYVELPLSLLVEEDAVGRRKAAKKKKKDGLGEGGRVVPGAVAQTVE